VYDLKPKTWADTFLTRQSQQTAEVGGGERDPGGAVKKPGEGES